MNIKNLRKHYQNLSKRERFILYDSAESRNDKSEMEAILAASPKQDWIMCDLGIQLDKLFDLKMIRIIDRLKHSRNALFFLFSDTNESEINSLARLFAYFYCVSADSTETILQELGLDNQLWKKKENELFNLEVYEQIIDELMREIAFDQTELEEFFKGLLKVKGKGKIEIAFSYENEVENLRNLIKKSPLKEVWKD